MRSFRLGLAAAALIAAALIAAPLAAQPLPVGPAIPLETTGASLRPSIAIGPDGGFLAAWAGVGSPSVSVRAFTAAGHPLLSGASAVNAGGLPGVSPEIASLGTGRYVVLWEDNDDLPGALPSVSGRLLDASGEPIGNINRIAIGRSGDVAGLPSGDYVAVWQHLPGQIRARRFNAATPVTGEIVVAPVPGVDISVAAMPDDGFVVAWQFGGAIFFRVFGPTGAPVTGPVQASVPGASQRHPRISTDATGRIVIAWFRDALPADDQILVRRFSPSGGALGAAVPVRAARNLGPPQVAARPDGSFLVLWTESTANEALAFAQVFDAQGLRVGDAFRVHETPEAIAGQAAADENGWLVGWSDANGTYLRRLVTTCGTGTPGMCLNAGRFHVQVAWREPATSATVSGHPIQLSGYTGAFWFFAPDNTELTVKVLDGRGFNDRFWVFYASLTDVQFDLTVTDRATGASRTWRNLRGTLASQADTDAFADLGEPPPPPVLNAPLFLPRPLAAGPQLALLSVPSSFVDVPRLAAGDDGFAAGWLAFPPPPGVPDPTLTARGFHGSGRALGVEQPVSSAFEDPRVDPFDLVALVSGDLRRYAAVWTHPEAATGEVSARLLDAAGAPLAPPVVLAQDALDSRAAALAAGGFVAVWRRSSSDLTVARQFTNSVTPAGPEIVVGTGFTPDIVALPDGGFAVAWEMVGPQVPSIFLRLFAPDGTPRGPIQRVSVADRFDSGPRIAADAAGRLVVVWNSASGLQPGPFRILARRLGADGQPAGPEILVQEDAGGVESSVRSVAMQSDGSFLVLSERLTESGGDQPMVVAHLYDPAGTPLGTFPVHDEEKAFHAAGDVVPAGDGWLVSWRRSVLDVSQSLHARLFTSTCGASLGLCLNGGRFRVEASWHIPRTDQRGTAKPVVLSDNTGTFWFFSADNTELIVKVLDGRGVNGHFWVFYGSLSNVEFDLTVTDTLTGQQRTWHNPAGTMASRADTEAF